MMNTLRERIRKRLADLKITASAASVRAGLSKNAIGEMLAESGRQNTNPTIATLERIANTLDCDVEYLLGKQDTPRGGLGFRSSLAKIPVVGTVRAGSFDVMTGPEPWLSDHEAASIDAPRSIRFPRARHFAMRVAGDSMNAASPRAIQDGELALFIDVIDTEMPITDGNIYLVRRTQDAGQSHEWTLKRARVYSDRIELIPESTNPQHKPVAIPTRGKKPPPDGTEIVAVGLLYGMHYSFEAPTR